MNANEIVIGMPATIAIGSDRFAATVVSVKKTRIEVQEDTAIRTDRNGISESQSYRFEPNPNGTIWVCKLDCRGNWLGKLPWMSSRRAVATVFVGRRDHYHDPCF